jgi:AraC family transcriptional activator of pobA
MLVFIRQGNLIVTIDFETYEIIGPNLLMVFPNQVHHLIPQDKLSGWAISFEGDFISKDLRDALDKNWRDRASVYIDVSPGWLDQVDALLSSILQLNDRPLVTAQPIVSGLLTAVLFIILGHLVPEESMDKSKNKRPAIIKNQFITLL